MDLNIHDSYTLQEVQAAFNNHFPNLKLEFFNSDPARKFDFSKENLITDTHKTLAEVRHIHRTGHISINGHQKVSTLEKHFGENFGMIAGAAMALSSVSVVSNSLLLKWRK